MEIRARQNGQILSWPIAVRYDHCRRTTSRADGICSANVERASAGVVIPDLVREAWIETGSGWTAGSCGVGKRSDNVIVLKIVRCRSALGEIWFAAPPTIGLVATGTPRSRTCYDAKWVIRRDDGIANMRSAEIAVVLVIAVKVIPAHVR